MSEQEAGVAADDPEKAAVNLTEVTASDTDVDKEADKSVAESAPAEIVSGDDTAADNSAAAETNSSSATEANDSKTEESNVENVESTEPQADVSQVEVTEPADIVVATVAETVSSSVNESGKTDDSSDQTKSEETSSAKSELAAPAAEQNTETNAADSTIESSTPAPQAVAVVTTNRETAGTEAVAAGRTANRTTQDVTKMSGNDELKFGVLIGLVRVGQLSNKEVVDSVLSLVSMFMYEFGFSSITINRHKA